MNKNHFLIALSDVSQDGTTLSITDMSGTLSWCDLHHFCPERGKCNESSAPLAGRCPASVGAVAFRALGFTRCLLPAGGVKRREGCAMSHRRRWPGVARLLRSAAS